MSYAETLVAENYTAAEAQLTEKLKQQRTKTHIMQKLR
jgi:hypothetical protein